MKFNTDAAMKILEDFYGTVDLLYGMDEGILGDIDWDTIELEIDRAFDSEDIEKISDLCEAALKQCYDLIQENEAENRTGRTTNAPRPARSSHNPFIFGE